MVCVCTGPGVQNGVCVQGQVYRMVCVYRIRCTGPGVQYGVCTGPGDSMWCVCTGPGVQLWYRTRCTGEYIAIHQDKYK